MEKEKLEKEETLNEALQEKEPLKEEVVKLESKKLYSLQDLLKQGYTIAYLKINRKCKESALKSKMKSLEVTNGAISPGLVVTAEYCLKSGLACVTVDGGEITEETEGLDKIIVIVDGQHRLIATRMLNEKVSKEKPSKAPYDFFVYLPLHDDVPVQDMLKESNVATNPWKGSDFLTTLILEAKTSIDTTMLQWILDHREECGDTALWRWARLDLSEKHKKADFIKAGKDDKVLKEIAESAWFTYGRKLYEAATKKLSSEITKLKDVPEWFIKKITANPKDSVENVSNTLLDFINSLQESDVAAIKDTKKDNTISKGAKIADKLDALFTEFNKE